MRQDCSLRSVSNALGEIQAKLVEIRVCEHGLINLMVQPTNWVFMFLDGQFWDTDEFSRISRF
jgi:hypothetical protein